MARWRSQLPDLCPQGLILGRQRSAFTGEPVVVAATGFGVPSTNDKTSDMLQVYIMPEAQTPFASTRTGHDEAVCGTCRFRPALDGACYVNTAWGPGVVYRTVQSGGYATEWQLEWFRGALVRLGAWGDPAAVSLDLWLPIVEVAHNVASYTHHWRHLDAKAWRFCMASVDTAAEAREAWSRGWRTFRAIPEGEEPLPEERECLSDSHGIPCAACKGCDGTLTNPRRPPYWIRRHGPRRRFAGGQGMLFDRLPERT